MPTVHMLGHMVAMAIIATLVKQLMELNDQFNDLRFEQERIAEKCDSRVTTCSDDDNNSDMENSKLPTVTTSVWCYDGSSQMCRFTNLCYNSNEDEFVMFKGEGSVVVNVEMVDGTFTLDLSSVKDHNARQTSIVSLPSRTYFGFSTTWVSDTTLVFRQFLPDNLMHMFHDDILPLHQTLQLIQMNSGRTNLNESYNVQIFLFDNDEDIFNETDQIKFYEIFTKMKISYKKNFQNNGGLVCFDDIYIGLSKTTTWYDFGFTKPQGPIDNFESTGEHIHSTVKYILHHLDVSSEENYGITSEYLVMFTRKTNRRILNEIELTLNIVRNTGLKIINLSSESHGLPVLIDIVRNSRGIIGMHGSLLILSMFMKRGSLLIEFFPYAINPDNYTPYKTLSRLKGVELVYKSWANQNVENTVGHSDWSAEVGGLNHLESHQKEEIQSQTEVPEHLCCSDPSWLYHIYQDTVVDIEEVTSLVQSSLKESKKLLQHSNSDEDNLFYPSKVQNVKCVISHSAEKWKNNKNKQFMLFLNWKIPWTVEVVGEENIHYEVLIQDLNDETKAVVTQHTISNSLTLSIHKDSMYYVWVRCVVNDVQSGPYSDAVACSHGHQ